MPYALHRLVAIVVVLLVPGLVVAGDACEPVEGLAERIVPGRIFLLGEMHGTQQSPAFASSVACAVAAREMEVVVGLELASSAQERVDRYLESPGRPADREALLQHDIWTRSYQDGRTSEAMLDLIERVRRLRHEGNSARILFFDAPTATGGQDRETKMAHNIAASAGAHPAAVHVILTGNLHSRTVPGSRRDRDYEPMGYLLQQQVPGNRIVALSVGHEGGSAWICAPDCGVVSLAGHHAGSRWSIEIDDATRPSGHLGWYHVGTLSASVPAVGDFEVPQESPLPVEPAETAEKKKRKTEQVDSPAVDKLQGRWQAYQNGARVWTIEFDGLGFHAVLGPDDWYRGEIFVRSGETLSEIDFLIQDCVCGYKGESSDGIYRWDDDTMTLAAPRPGTRRPTLINAQKGEVVQLRKIAE